MTLSIVTREEPIQFWRQTLRGLSNTRSGVGIKSLKVAHTVLFEHFFVKLIAFPLSIIQSQISLTKTNYLILMLTSNFHNAYSAKQNDVLFFIFPIVLHPSKVLHQTASSIYDDVRHFKCAKIRLFG